MSLDIRGLHGSQTPRLELLQRISNRALCSAIHFNVAGLERIKCLWPDMASDQDLHTIPNHSLACLYASSLRGIEVCGVADGFDRAGIRVNENEKLRSAEAWIEGRL